MVCYLHYLNISYLFSGKIKMRKIVCMKADQENYVVWPDMAAGG